MERRKPLQRRTALKARTALKRSPVKRTEQDASVRPRRAAATGAGARRTRPRKRSEQERAAMLAWKVAITADASCASCGARDVELDGHHVVKQQTLERVERQRGLAPGTLLWDRDSGIALCSQWAPNRCHPRHDLAVKRVTRDCLPANVVRFALALGPVGERALSAYPDVPAGGNGRQLRDTRSERPRAEREP